MLSAAERSAACGLFDQAARIVARIEAVLPDDAPRHQKPELHGDWNIPGGSIDPKGSLRSREEALWRRVRKLRASRRPYDGAQHPGRQGLAWGPYNRTSAVVEALEAAARVDPLWVDDLLERERAAGAIDRLLGL